MREQLEIEKELEFIRLSLKISYKDSFEQLNWEGYRDALAWVLCRDISRQIDPSNDLMYKEYQENTDNQGL